MFAMTVSASHFVWVVATFNAAMPVVAGIGSLIVSRVAFLSLTGASFFFLLWYGFLSGVYSACVGGFKSHYHLVSGDDDLLIQEAAKKRNYTVQFAHDAFCYSEAHTEWFRWRLQKTRHYSTSGRYDVIKKALLGIYPVTLWWVAISFILLCWIQEVGYLELGMLSGVVLVKWGIMGKGLRKMKEPGLAWFFPG